MMSNFFDCVNKNFSFMDILFGEEDTARDGRVGLSVLAEQEVVGDMTQSESAWKEVYALKELHHIDQNWVDQRVKCSLSKSQADQKRPLCRLCHFDKASAPCKQDSESRGEWHTEFD